MSEVEVFLPSTYRQSRWKNGQGTSYDIASAPEDARWDGLIWRLSIADIERDAAFSEFPGIDRTFVAIAGGGLTLEPEGHAPIAVPGLHEPVSFPGDWRMNCRLRAGPARAFNVFSARASARHSVRIVRETESIPTRGLAFVHALGGEIRCQGASVPVGATARAGGDALDIACGAGGAAILVDIRLENAT
jgi:environmental stress-induced protein Ves